MMGDFVNGTFLVTTTTVVVGAIAWAVRLESKIQLSDQKHTDLKELIESKLDSIADRLERIERAMNGALYGRHNR